MQLSQSNSQRSFQWLLCLALLALTSAANANNWNYLDGPYGGQPLALFSDAAGNTWAGMNGSGAYLRAAGTTRWARPAQPEQRPIHH